jgi:hypothetical protein
MLRVEIGSAHNAFSPPPGRWLLSTFDGHLWAVGNRRLLAPIERLTQEKLAALHRRSRYTKVRTGRSAMYQVAATSVAAVSGGV